MNMQSLDRRHVLAGLAGAVVVAQAARADGKKDAHAHHATPNDAPAAPSSPALTAIAASTAECQQAGRACLAACTEHLVAGMTAMAPCQRAVMNMLAVSEAMADVAGFHNADPKHIKALAVACAQFCRACAAACAAHAEHHIECKACMDACKACATACEAL
jgi:Cys-rich four helix bundle protein (predicted Tat secretion target)